MNTQNDVVRQLAIAKAKRKLGLALSEYERQLINYHKCFESAEDK